MGETQRAATESQSLRERSALAAVVFDLDGVLTRTASLHEAAWKEIFDAALPRLTFDASAGRPFTREDYATWVDGKPRLDGIRSFLSSRGIVAPEGTADDPPSATTVHALGNAKNAAFHALLEARGPEVDAAAIALVQSLRRQGVPVGVASSSRNTEAVLRRAGIAGLFDARVDGENSAALGLRGKPAPDIFVECLRRLGRGSFIDQSVVVEDAASGVAAGVAGRFGLVIGIDAGGNRGRLRDAGAHWVLSSLGEVTADDMARFLRALPALKPNPLSHWAQFVAQLRGRSPAVFLDYDGTLTPIVARPEDARLSECVRESLRSLANRWPTFVISGRGLDDVRERIGIEALWYAGSHGFDIAGPAGSGVRRVVAPEVERDVHAAFVELRGAAARIPGAIVEDKRFSVAVHFRQVSESAEVAELEQLVDAAAQKWPSLKKTYGKKIFELRPAFHWDKGTALRWLLEAARLGNFAPIYVGDDVTDEDAFRSVSQRGAGVVVSLLPRETAASWAVQDPEDVRLLLERLAALRAEAS